MKSFHLVTIQLDVSTSKVDTKAKLVVLEPSLVTQGKLPKGKIGIAGSDTHFPNYFV